MYESTRHELLPEIPGQTWKRRLADFSLKSTHKTPYAGLRKFLRFSFIDPEQTLLRRHSK